MSKQNNNKIMEPKNNKWNITLQTSPNKQYYKSNKIINFNVNKNYKKQ